jgi:ketosteroid isomerase-like protein
MKTPAGRIVDAFDGGDCDALAAMYTEDVVWRLNHSLAPNIKGTRRGERRQGFRGFT